MKWGKFWERGYASLDVGAKDGLLANLHHGDAGVGVQIAPSRMGASVALTLDPDDEDALRFHAGVWPLPTVYFHAAGRAAYHLARRIVGQDGREVSAWVGGDESIDRVSFFWNLGGRVMGWACEDPAWQRGSWAPLATLFGEAEYESEVLARESGIEVLMPEGAYHLTVTLTRDVWRRPRWPGVWTEVRRATVKVEGEGGIPTPGKGENEWDCDEDAMCELSVPAESLGDGVRQFVERVHRERFRHGGPCWRPEPAPQPQDEA